MAQGGASYAGVTYLIDMAFGADRGNKKEPIMDKEYAYQE